MASLELKLQVHGYSVEGSQTFLFAVDSDSRKWNTC